MYLKIRHITHRFLTVLAASFIVLACSDIDLDFTAYPDQEHDRETIIRVPSENFRNIFIVYSMGYNNISRYLKEDIEELIANTDLSNGRDRVIIFSHLCQRGIYNVPTSPILTEVSNDIYGNVICDTLKIYPDSVIGADAETVNDVLTYIKDEFPAESYGILFSSHGTGWTPENYCIDPSDFDPDEKEDNIWGFSVRRNVLPKPAWVYPDSDDIPMVKGIGVHESPKNTYREMEIQELADAIPMKMDYIIFDACFMGGIEVAYEFRDICDMMVASQTEIIAEGMDYVTMVSYLLNSEKPDLEGFCDNYYIYYNTHSNTTYRSATISLIDCRKLEPLAESCRAIFSTCRDGIASLEGRSLVQPYYQKSYAHLHKWFHDLESIVTNCGASEEQLGTFRNALEGCVIYKAATESFFNSEIKINTHSGLSMYLPYKNRTYLNDFYKTLEWNKATGLVQ